MYEIYVVTNLQNGKNYVGQTSRGIAARWIQHRSAAKRGVDNYFYRALRKYGEDGFVRRVVETCRTADEANAAERRVIAQLGALDSERGYNGTLGGDGSLPTTLTRAKLSAARKEQFRDPEFKRRMAQANTGKHHTATGRANISAALRGNQYRAGIPHDEATKARIRESLRKAYAEGRHVKGKGLAPGTKLGPMSEAMKLRISEGVRRARKAKFWSTRKKSFLPNLAAGGSD